MVDIPGFKTDVSEEVSTILAPDFAVNITATNAVPHSDDAAITFPNLDEGWQRVKVVETAVLYVDMHRSTQLSLHHHPHTVAKLYSAFVRAMTRCAKVFNGEVRGIIGDRVMMLFDNADCYANAVYTAILINSVCQYVINKHFPHEEVAFGIGIDYGRMLATKTGIRRHGSAQQSYRSLVWLGRPANVASKLTDNANKPEETFESVKLRVGYDYLFDGTPPVYRDEWPHEVVQKFTYDPLRKVMVAPNFHSWTVVKERIVTAPATPPILMSKRVYDGFVAARPLAPEIADRRTRLAPHHRDMDGDGEVRLRIRRSGRGRHLDPCRSAVAPLPEEAMQTPNPLLAVRWVGYSRRHVGRGGGLPGIMDAPVPEEGPRRR